MKATCIKWDVDFYEFENEQEYEDYLSELPTEIDIPDGMEDEDEISDTEALELLTGGDSG